MSESTPLLSATGASSNAYYFLQRPSNDATRSLARAEGGDAVVNILPDGATQEEFSSRPVNVRLHLLTFVILWVCIPGSSAYYAQWFV
jgi:hypothetical protein